MTAAKPGDSVEVVTSEETIKGTLLQTPELEKGVVIIKLSSGYNIGISKDKIKKIALLPQQRKEEQIEKAVAAAKEKTQRKLPKISILHTGGTIASKVDYRTGGVVARFTPQEILEMFPELKEIAEIDSRLIRNMWSEDMRFAHYNIMAKEAAKEAAKGADGVIITHGTDTLHYSSAALAFALEGIGIPVILVGAQRSSDRGSTDAATNLISAAYFIANSDFAGVAICMHENMSDSSSLILPATKARKMHTSRRDAFRPINSTATARIDYEGRNIAFLAKDHPKKDKARKLQLRLFNEKLKIGILKTHPNMYTEEFAAYQKFDGLVIEGFALGQAPINQVDEFTTEHKRILAAIAALCKKMPVAMASQSIYGRLQMNVYSTARDLQAAGVIGNLSDMTPETTFVKLAWLLSNYKKAEVKELITKNLRGEISERTEPAAFLV
ncbi:Glu-tRNA(Gln) amidotransferase subunit GatD [Candidatus Woesearchaeota archaeon]|nr:Glu-tRNA(Gln) amidotransferase subunit GatD [Candidatus Woesearchaeota archaeon]